VLHLSSGQWVFYGALSIVWAILGYRLSENDRKMLGRTPWGLPSMLWAFFWFLSLILGLVLYLIAHSLGVRQAQRNGPYTGVAAPIPPSTMARSSSGRTPSASDMFPAYPRPANSTPPEVDEVELDPPDPAGAPADWTNSPPSWHPDPSGRFHYRWWDGAEWTSQVSTDGHHLVDTNPDQRTGPY
jgi:Protein of unknown function (DUF2510)